MDVTDNNSFTWSATASSSCRTAGSSWSAASGHRLGSDLDVRPDVAVFVGNDHMSIGLLSALRQRGLRVPEDISVIGFDDVPEAGYLFPPLTTVRQDFDGLGELIMQKVLIATATAGWRRRGALRRTFCARAGRA